jgi:16S rRNA (adenine1518-N6/adenine1519-N6)-dimethyltransferase
MAKRIDIRALLRRYRLHPKKSWSQNFLVDEEVLESIALATESEGKTVVELGAGLGVLTERLAQKAGHVVAVERDRDLAGVLREEFREVRNVEVLEENAARLNYEAMRNSFSAKPIVVGNLPYHMATPILFHLLQERVHLAQWVLMFQKEVADRLMAKPGNRTYGVLSVLVQMRADVEPVVAVSPKSFYPVPKVHSAVVRFRPMGTRFPVHDERTFDRLVKAAFSNRRKTIRNSLSLCLRSSLALSGIDDLLKQANVNPTDRAETLSIETYARMSNILKDMDQ